MIHFANPEALWLLLLVPPIVFAYYKSLKKRKSDGLKFTMLGFVKQAQNKTTFRRDAVFYMTLLSLVILVFALADPLLPLKRTKEGVNVVLVIDVSGSMQATDYKPSRIEAAKASGKILLESLQAKDYAGIVVFESGATTAAYLSPNKGRVIEKLMAIQPKQGRTAIGDGLILGIDMALSVPNKKKVVILLSDGVNNAGVISPAEAVEFANQNGVQVNTVGMGTEERAIIGYDFFGNPQYAELDEATLKAIAEQTGGKYYKSVNEKTLEEIYKRISGDIKREKEDTSIRGWLIALAALVLLFELYVRYGKYRIICE
ncbi:MAG: VWA domain-containing protein [Candidatus Woesearchaeota archaeon]